MTEPMTPLTDAQLAAIAERNTDPWNWYIARSDIPALLASHRALAARLAEAERESFARITAMRLQIQDWIDEGVSRVDMQAFLDSEGKL